MHPWLRINLGIHFPAALHPSSSTITPPSSFRVFWYKSKSLLYPPLSTTSLNSSSVVTSQVSSIVVHIMGTTRAKRRNAHVKTTAKARVVSPSLSASSSSSSSSSSAALADGPPLVDRFAPADPTAKNLHPYPPNRRPIFELFDPDELLAMATCQRDVYTEKHGEMEHRRHVLRERNRGREWSYGDQVEYSHVKAYRGLLCEKKRFWELLCLEGTKPLPLLLQS